VTGNLLISFGAIEGLAHESFTKMNQQTPQASTQIRLALQFSADQSILRKGQGPSILRQKVARRLVPHQKSY
jgi:hypothetical protein